MLPKAFSLSDQIIGAIDIGQTDIVFSGNDVGRQTRSQEVGNCWTYPSMNSIETSAIAKGLVTDPSQAEGNEWHLSLNHSGTWPRRLAVNVKEGEGTFKQFAPSFGGQYFYATSYFASGKTGAFVVQTPEQRKAVKDTVDQGEKYFEFETFEDKLTESQLKTLYQDPDEKRSFSYETGITLDSTRAAKRYMKRTNTSAYVAFSFGEHDAIDFHSYRWSADGGKKYSHWIDPSSLRLVDSEGKSVTIDAFLEAARVAGILDDTLAVDSTNQFDLSSTPGDIRWAQGEKQYVDAGVAGHAVTAIAWNDDYVQPTVNLLDKLIDAIFSKYKQGRQFPKESIAFRNWATSNGYAYTNSDQESKGAWYIQNSWGTGGDKEFQYLPYSMISGNQYTFHELDNTGILGDVDSSAVVPPINQISNLTLKDAIGYNFKQIGNTPVAALGLISLEGVQPIGGLIQGSIYRLDDLDGEPIVSTNAQKQIHGYQTLRFDESISLDSEVEYVAVIEASNQGVESENAVFASFDIDNPSQLRDATLTDFKPSQARYFHDLPLKDLDLIKTSDKISDSENSISIAENVYFAKHKDNQWVDVGVNGQAFMLNVVYENQDTIVSNNQDVITGGPKSDNIFLNDRRNTVFAGKGDDIVYVNAARNTIRLGSGNDVLIATEAKGNRLKVQGGDGMDSFVYSMGIGSHFKGKSTIKNFGDLDQILVHGFDDDLSFKQNNNGQVMVITDDFRLMIKGDSLDGINVENGVITI